MADTRKSPPAPTRTSRGRQKIEIKKRENVDHRRVTFTKRRTGLFEKAAELCTLCGAKIAILTFSEGKKAFCFGNPDTDAVLKAYLSGRNPINIEPSGAYLQVLNESKQMYLEALTGLETERSKAKAVHQMPRHGGFWWDTPTDDLAIDELKYYHKALEQMMSVVAAKIKKGSNEEPVSGHGLLDQKVHNLVYS